MNEFGHQKRHALKSGAERMVETDESATDAQTEKRVLTCFLSKGERSDEDELFVDVEWAALKAAEEAVGLEQVSRWWRIRANEFRHTSKGDRR
jgi:hypothetical protein